MRISYSKIGYTILAIGALWLDQKYPLRYWLVPIGFDFVNALLAGFAKSFAESFKAASTKLKTKGTDVSEVPQVIMHDRGAKVA